MNQADVPEEQARDKQPDLAREVIETRNQMIKTANAVSSLAGEVRQIARLHERLDRGRTINSVAAYLAFLLLIGGGFFFTHRARIERVEFEKDVMVRQHAAVANQLKEEQQAQQARRQAETKALTFYRLMDERQVHRAIEKYPEVSRLPLSKVEAAVFRDWVARNRNRLAYEAYSAGMRLVDEKQWRRAVAEFERSLSLVPKPVHGAQLHYFLGVALMRLGGYPEAAEAMERALGFDAERIVSREIRYYLGSIYEQVGQRDKARAAYREYLKRNPATHYARVARRSLKQLEQ